jgi:hypothetical protein
MLERHHGCQPTRSLIQLVLQGQASCSMSLAEVHAQIYLGANNPPVPWVCGVMAARPTLDANAQH